MRSLNGGIGGPTFLFPDFATGNTADLFTFPTVTGGTPGTPTINLSVSASTP